MSNYTEDEKKQNQVYFINRTKERIPNWAVKSNQYNHKIVRAFFKLSDQYGKVTKDHLQALCSNKEHPDTYVPKFELNFRQMVFEGPHAHGKVFDVEGDYVTLYEPLAKTLLTYKDKFLHA